MAPSLVTYPMFSGPRTVTLYVTVTCLLLLRTFMAASCRRTLTSERNATDAALNAADAGSAQISFLLNATKLDQLRDIAYEGNVMPQKSTDFYPKVLSGLLLYSLDD